MREIEIVSGHILHGTQGSSKQASLCLVLIRWLLRADLRPAGLWAFVISKVAAVLSVLMIWLQIGCIIITFLHLQLCLITWMQRRCALKPKIHVSSFVWILPQWWGVIYWGWAWTCSLFKMLHWSWSPSRPHTRTQRMSVKTSKSQFDVEELGRPPEFWHQSDTTTFGKFRAECELDFYVQNIRVQTHKWASGRANILIP